MVCRGSGGAQPGNTGRGFPNLFAFHGLMEFLGFVYFTGSTGFMNHRSALAMCWAGSGSSAARSGEP